MPYFHSHLPPPNTIFANPRAFNGDILAVHPAGTCMLQGGAGRARTSPSASAAISGNTSRPLPRAFPASIGRSHRRRHAGGRGGELVSCVVEQATAKEILLSRKWVGIRDPHDSKNKERYPACPVVENFNTQRVTNQCVVFLRACQGTLRADSSSWPSGGKGVVGCTGGEPHPQNAMALQYPNT